MKDFPYFPIRYDGEPLPGFKHRVFRFWKNYFRGQKRKELRAAKAAGKAQNNLGSSQGVKRMRSVGNKSSQPDKRRNVQSVGIPRGINKFCSGRNPRSLILTNKSLIKSSTFTDRDVVICEEHKNGKTTYYVSVYWDINFYDIPKTFVEFMDYQVGKTNDYRYGLQRPLGSLGMRRRKRKRREIGQFIANYCLSIINRGSTLTFKTSRAPEYY